jgi:hypothetical protein
MKLIFDEFLNLELMPTEADECINENPINNFVTDKIEIWFLFANFD